MPELPEVRTVCAVLRQKVLQKTIAHVAIHWPKLVKYPTQDLFTEQLIGQQIQQIKQKGKHILFLLDDFCLISHLRMEGKYFYIADPQNMTADVVKHALVIFTFTDQSLLVYHDTRRFGTMHLYRLDQYEQAPVLLRVGPEPFVATVNGAYLWEHYQKTRRPIKTVLLEQQVMSGLGNIYANEVLFATKINPYLPANQLNVAQCEAIVKASRKILTAAIAQGGTTISSYHPEEGVDGKFTAFLQVHGRKNQPCYLCHHLIQKDFLNQRGLYYCAMCQKQPEG